MATTVEYSVTINKDVDTVFNMIVSEDFLKTKLEALGARNVEILEASSDGGGANLKYNRQVPADAPSALKKFVKEWSDLKAVDTWTGSAGGDRSCNMEIDIDAPVDMSGTVKLTANGDSTTMTSSMTVKCGIPLVGKKLEQFAATNVEKETQDDLNYTKEKAEA